MTDDKIIRFPAKRRAIMGNPVSVRHRAARQSVC
jgi:hypothetical protein